MPVSALCQLLECILECILWVAANNCGMKYISRRNSQKQQLQEEGFDECFNGWLSIFALKISIGCTYYKILTVHAMGGNHNFLAMINDRQ